MKTDKYQMEDKKELKAEEAPQVNYVNKPNDAPPTMNGDNDPSVSWHLESGDKLNDYNK